MNFQQTGLPDRPLFRAAFEAGWERFLSLRPKGKREGAARLFLAGPVAMARLVAERGGDCRQVAAAACLAGPAAFSARPDARLDKKIRDFAGQIMGVEAAGAALYAAVPHLSPDARLFLQASAVMLLGRLADAPGISCLEETRRGYGEALSLYSAARGGHDTWRLDTRFEIAAMKVMTLLEGGGHLWARESAYVSV